MRSADLLDRRTGVGPGDEGAGVRRLLARWGLPLFVVMSMAPACSAGSDIDHGDSGACGLYVRLDGRVYVAYGVKVLPTYGPRLGTAIVEPCVPEDPGGWGIEAVEIVGVSPKVAFGSRDWSEGGIHLAPPGTRCWGGP
jgi:hypothetical protein